MRKKTLNCKELKSVNFGEFLNYVYLKIVDHVSTSQRTKFWHFPSCIYWTEFLDNINFNHHENIKQS